MGAPATLGKTHTGKTRIEYGHTSPALVFAADTLMEINLLPQLSGGLILDRLDLMASCEHDVVAALHSLDIIAGGDAANYLRIGPQTENGIIGCLVVAKKRRQGRRPAQPAR